jgi:exopolyphosphatase/guanosine-5'-triphosphate,3'-diphosphate pyrophosphatase
VRGINAVSSNRRNLLPYGAILLNEIINIMNPDKIVFSAVGVREGYLYSLLPDKVKKADPLITAAEEMAVLRARSPVHSRELAQWTKQAFKTFGMKETKEEARFRKAACLLADITWRSHPDYRGDQALNLISNANFVGVNHPGRAYLALSSFYRHEGLVNDNARPAIGVVANKRITERAKLLGALFRVGYLFSAAMPGILPEIEFRRGDEIFEITLPKHLAEMEGERLDRRISGLSNVLRQPVEWSVR